MTKILGDLALPLRGLEQEFKVIQKDEVTYEDGYAQPDESYEKPFKGILIDKDMSIAEMQGIRGEATRWLYIRLSQEWYPDLVEGDIVIDTEERKWKVVERYDYEHYANTKVFGVARVDP